MFRGPRNNFYISSKIYSWPTFYCFLRFLTCSTVHSSPLSRDRRLFNMHRNYVRLWQLNKYFYDLSLSISITHLIHLRSHGRYSLFIVPTGPVVIVKTFFSFFLRKRFQLVSVRMLFFMEKLKNFDRRMKKTCNYCVIFKWVSTTKINNPLTINFIDKSQSLLCNDFLQSGFENNNKI